VGKINLISQAIAAMFPQQIKGWVAVDNGFASRDGACLHCSPVRQRKRHDSGWQKINANL
jgi:hypothetical protein